MIKIVCRYFSRERILYYFLEGSDHCKGLLILNADLNV